jgi:hypothetical protein
MENLQWEKGQSYKNGRGYKCRLIEILKSGQLVWVREHKDGEESIYTTRGDGKIWTDEASCDDINVKDKWREPTKMVVYMYYNSRDDEYFISHKGPECYDNYDYVKLVAIKEIVEGEGL